MGKKYMGKKDNGYYPQSKFTSLLMNFAIIVAAGLFGCFFITSQASAVSGVALADNDTTGFGLDGRDFTVTWTPGSEPAGYQMTMVYILPSTTTLAVNTLATACAGNGGVCQHRGMFMYQAMATTTLPQFATTDSNGQAWATSTSYVAWLYTSSTVPTIASSSAVSYASASDTLTDTNAPQVMHFSVSRAEESAAANIYAFINDDQTTAAAFANLLDAGNEYVRVYYGADVSSASSVATGTLVTGNLFRFVIPTTTVAAAGNTFEYYVVANDGSDNTSYFCNNFSATSLSDCNTEPFAATSVTVVGGLTVAGTISSDGLGLASSVVFAGGFAAEAVVANGSGVFTIGSLPTSTMYNIEAVKDGYCPQSRQITVGSANMSGVDISLNAGNCGFDPGGGDGPQIRYTMPMEGMDNVSTSTPMRAGLSTPMDATTINDADASNTGSNVYLTTDDGTTKIAGQALYCADSTTPGCSSLDASETNVILFIPTSNLSSSTFYTLVITEAVLSGGGQSINGNRPGGGHNFSFNTQRGSFSAGEFTLGQGGGQYMPPYVRSVNPAPGMTATPNTGITLEFNNPMKSSSINTTNIVLYNITDSSNVSLTSVTLSGDGQIVTIAPASPLTAGSSYEIRVLGAVASASNITMRTAAQASEFAFSSAFSVGSTNDTTSPTIYPALANNSTGVVVNRVFDFGFSEQLSHTTVNGSNITFRRGSTLVDKQINYDSSKNKIFVSPNSVLAQNTVYSVTFGKAITDLAGNAISTTTYTYTTGGADTTAATLRMVQCDDYTCQIVFSESMNNDTQVDTNWASSTLNHAVLTLTQGGADLITANTSLSYDPSRNTLDVQGLSLTVDTSFIFTATGVTDLSGNIMTASSTGMAQNSNETFGSFGNDQGMFGPPKSGFMGGGGIGGGEFKPQGFGGFTTEQFAMGQAARVFPMNQTAGQDSNVLSINYTPGIVLLDGDQIAITLADGTTVTNAAIDTFSPTYSDYHMNNGATVTGTAVSADNSLAKVTVTLGISGTTAANDPYMIDLRRIVNPAIPSGPSSGGYTATLQVLRGGEIIANETSMPYFINAGGTNTITIDIFAGSATTSPAAGADGNVFIFGGGPAGPLDKNVTLTDGDVSAVDGTAATEITLSNLTDGCYFFGTESMVTLGSIDYFGQMTPEPVCVNSGNSANKNLLLTPSTGSSSATVTVKFGGGLNFNGADIDIFGGGPGKFVVKTLSGVTTPAAGGYAIKLPSNGLWNLGVGPAMSKGTTKSEPTPLAGVPPSSANLLVSGVGTTPAITTAGTLPPGVTFDDSTDVITFTFSSADKTVTGTVKDGSGNGLSNVHVMIHRQGFGAPIFGNTDNSGVFAIALSDYGNYTVEAFKDGLPPVAKAISIRADGNDAGSEPDIYVAGNQITDANPLVLTVNKADYTISGKVLDSNNNGIGYVGVFARDANGNTVFGGTSSDGSYSLFVSAGTWTVIGELPPSKSDTCGTFSTTVVVTTASQANQNITPSAGTCYALSGTVSAGSSNLANIPIFVQEWDTVNNRPADGGLMKPGSTDSSGVYSVEVSNGTYRIGTLHSNYGELSTSKTVAGSNATANITVATIATTTFVFTGGDSGMEALVEVKHSSDITKGVRRQHKGLNNNLQIGLESGITYNYFIDVFGYGVASGTVVAGATSTMDVSAGDYITVTGTIQDASSNALVGALVTFSSSSASLVKTAVTDSSGNYNIKVKTGTYKVNASLEGYIPGQVGQSATFNATTTGYSFGSGEEQSALSTSDQNITGILRDSNSTAMTNGYVWAENTAGVIVRAAVDQTDGSYSLPVVDGSWTVKGSGPLHDQTTKSGTIVISGGNSASNNFNLTENATKIPTSTTGVLSANVGGAIDDRDGSGIKVSAAGGILESGNGNVTLGLERTYTAPDSENFSPLSNATFEITANGTSEIKDLSGNIDIQIDYTDLISDLPSGITESSLQLAYYSTERNEYVKVEGGSVIDTVNNTITGMVDHLSEFALIFATNESAPSTPVGLSAAAGASEIILSWTAVAGVTGYDIYRDTSASGSFPRLGSEPTVAAGTTSYTDSSASIGTTYYYKVSAINANGESAASAAVSSIIAVSGGSGSSGSVDVSPPSNTSISIAGGAVSTTSTLVTLTLGASGVSQMMISNSTDFSSVQWENYSTTKAWTLLSGLGTKTVYAKFRDSSSNASSAVSDTIELTSTSTLSTATIAPAVTVAEEVGATTSKDDTIETVTTVAEAVKKTVSAVSKYVFTKYLGIGSDNTEVNELQKLLKDLGYFTYSKTTDYFGPITEKALKLFQKDKGISQVGWIGPQTRKALNEASSKSSAVSSKTVTEKVAVKTTPSGYTFTKYLYIGHENDEVKKLQLKLKELGYFTYPTATGYFGSVTKEAVVKFQKAKGISQVGWIGPQTRKALNSSKLAVVSSKTEKVAVKTTPSGYTFTKYLYIGHENDEVKKLQLKLKELGYFTYPTATGYFGSVTKEAVVKFQKAKNLSPYPGWIGSGTRKALNES